MRWVLLFALAWLIGVGLFAAGLLQSARTAPAPDTWSVTHAASAHRLLVVNVEASRPDRARTIATEIVDPLRAQYAEILVYVRPSKPTSLLHARRVQWTPQHGFVESAF